MKKLAFALVLTALMTAAPLVARAEDQKLPFNPYEKAQKGDWCVLTGSFKREGAGEKKISCASYTKVLSVTDDKVVIGDNEQAGGIERLTRPFSTKEAPTVKAFFALEGDVYDVKFEDEQRKVGDKDLATKKLTFVWTHDASKDEITAWLSPDVKGGLVAFHLKGKTTTATPVETTIKMEMAGYGTADKKEWGDAADELLDPEMLVEPDEPGETCEPPFNPFAKAKKGDWAAYKLEVEVGPKTENAVEGFEITDLTKEKVDVEASIRRAGGEARTHTVHFDPSKPPSALRFLSMIIKGGESSPDKEPGVKNMKLVDDKKTVGDKEFTCKLLSYTVTERGGSAKVKMWFSSDVKALGLVAAEISLKERAMGIKFTLELGGYGDDDKTIWGKTAEQLAKKAKKKKADDDDDDDK